MLQHIVSDVVVLLLVSAIQSATKWAYQYCRRMISGTSS